MFDRKPRVSGAYLLVLASLSVRAVDHAAKTVVIHTADSGEEAVALGEDTVVHEVTNARSAVDAEAKDALG
jgi:hypothetical protein